MRPAWSGFRSGRDNPVVCGRRFCPQCGRWRLVATEFHRFRSGALASWCRTCRRVANRAAAGRRTERQRELRREYQRIWMEGHRRKQGIPPRRFDYSPDNPRRRRTPIDNVERILLPRDPLIAEIHRFTRGRDLAELVRCSGVEERTIRRILTGESAHVRLDIADRLTTALAVPLALLYPHDDKGQAA